jgi:DnaJ-class molecular chaperone
MKNYLLLIATLLSFKGLTQSLDSSITALVHEIAHTVSLKNKVKLTLADFLNNEGKVDALTEYIWRELEEKLINEPNIMVMDRKHLKLLLEENHLQSQGLIDESVVKSGVAFTKIEGLVLGNITYIGDRVKIKINVTDIGSSFIYASASSGLIRDAAIKNLLEPEVKVCTQCKGKGATESIDVCRKCSGKGSSVCEECLGNGVVKGVYGNYPRCTRCNGFGKYTCKACSGKGEAILYQVCNKCNGKIQNGVTITQPHNNLDDRHGLDPCPDCMGSGRKKEQMNCQTCMGTRSVMRQYQMMVCPNCSGRGEIDIIYNCPKCNGTGKL